MSGQLHATAALLLRQYFPTVDPSALAKPLTGIQASVIQAVATLIMYQLTFYLLKDAFPGV
jgi:glyoxylate carboligase